MKIVTRRTIQAAMITTILAIGQLASAAEAQTSGASAEVVNINTATLDELTFLPGIGPSKAQAIIKYRSAKPFQNVEHIMRVKGIGRKTFKNLQKFIRIDGLTTLKSRVAKPVAEK